MLQTADSVQPPSTARPMRESEFESHDGTRLFYRTWPSTGVAPKGAIILLHRGHEHSGRVAHLATELGLDDFSFYAWDARGHGRSPGERGYSPSFAASAHDLDCFVRHVSETSGISVEDIAVIAQSVGAVLATTWVHDYAPPIRALVLASPAFSVKLYVPFAKEGIALWEKLKGTFFVNSYVKAKFLTHDPERIASYESDPLISRPIASNILVQLYEAAARVVGDARAITVPTQLLISGRDWVVRHAPQHRFYENLGSRIKERHVLAGFYHDTLGEKDRAIALAEVRRFIEARFAEPRAPADLRTAHIQGYTKDEADRLASPLDAASPRGIYWVLSRLNIKIGALVSEGIKTGVKTRSRLGSARGDGGHRAAMLPAFFLPRTVRTTGRTVTIGCSSHGSSRRSRSPWVPTSTGVADAAVHKDRVFFFGLQRGADFDRHLLPYVGSGALFAQSFEHLGLGQKVPL